MLWIFVDIIQPCVNLYFKRKNQLKIKFSQKITNQETSNKQQAKQVRGLKPITSVKITD